MFDDGGFSDLNTLSISDWFAHTPREVLSANFGVPESAFAYLPNKQVYIYQDQVPGPIQSQRIESPYGEIPLSFKHRLMAQPPLKTPGGSVRIVDSSNFPVSRNIAAALVEIEPGAMRELHWHPNNDEWQYYLSGQGRMTVFGGDGDARTFNVRAGDVGYVPLPRGIMFRIPVPILSGSWKCSRATGSPMSPSTSGWRSRRGSWSAAICMPGRS